MESKTTKNIITIPCISKSDSILQLIFLVCKQQYKIDMLRKKEAQKRQAQKNQDQKNQAQFVITFLFLLIGLRIIYLLPAGKEDLQDYETILEFQEERISSLQNELREIRYFYWQLVFVILSVGISFGYYFLSSLKKKIQHQEKIIAEHIYQSLISKEMVVVENKRVIKSSDFYLLFLSGITFSVFVVELYFFSTIVF